MGIACLFGHKWKNGVCVRCDARDPGFKGTNTGTAAPAVNQPEGGKKIVKTAGTCCICGKPLSRNPNTAPNLDELARFCTKCGTDICAPCLRKSFGSGYGACPVCGHTGAFEVNPMMRPK